MARDVGPAPWRWAACLLHGSKPQAPCCSCADCALCHQPPDRPWTGLAGELLRRLDPRLRYLVTTDALQSLEQAEGLDSIPSAVDDCDDDGDGLPLVATLSGIDLQVLWVLRQRSEASSWLTSRSSFPLQFDYEALQWERPAENLLRHSLRGTAGLAPLQIAAAAAWPAGSVQPTAPPCPSPLLRGAPPRPFLF